MAWRVMALASSADQPQGVAGYRDLWAAFPSSCRGGPQPEGKDFWEGRAHPIEYILGGDWTVQLLNNIHTRCNLRFTIGRCIVDGSGAGGPHFRLHPVSVDCLLPSFGHRSEDTYIARDAGALGGRALDTRTSQMLGLFVCAGPFRESRLLGQIVYRKKLDHYRTITA